MNRLDTTSELLSRWEEGLLGYDDPFGNWPALMRLRGHLRRLEALTDNELEAVDQWREQTSLPVDPSLSVRFNALRKHLCRMYNHAVDMQHDIDSLVQIYFSANAQRTNRILQFLTIVSAIFLPLNLLAGLFGMNFANLPMLQLWHGPWIVVCVMLVIVSGLLYWFRRRRWI